MRNYGFLLLAIIGIAAYGMAQTAGNTSGSENSQDQDKKNPPKSGDSAPSVKAHNVEILSDTMGVDLGLIYSASSMMYARSDTT